MTTMTGEWTGTGIPTEVPPLTELPKAARYQSTVELFDFELLERARAQRARDPQKRSRRIHWWWGPRVVQGWGHGAFCYLCDKPIDDARWAERFPITAQARAIVDSHRLRHRPRGPRRHDDVGEAVPDA